VIDPKWITTIETVREHLSEARRYVRSSAVHAYSYLSKALCGLINLDNQHIDDRWGYTIHRLRKNLIIAKGDMMAEPDVAIAYIDGARWELGKVLSELRKEGER
jgi:hypothetical protein